MANARKTVDFQEVEPVVRHTYIIDNSTITYDATKAGGSAMVGLAVNLSASKTVRLVSDAEPVLGVLVSVEPDLMATVQVGSVCTFKGGESATLTPGSKIVGALQAAAAKGYVRSVAAATLAEVAVATGAILDAATATAVKVRMP